MLVRETFEIRHTRISIRFLTKQEETLCHDSLTQVERRCMNARVFSERGCLIELKSKELRLPLRKAIYPIVNIL